jgi:ATP-dependent DNA helicase RecG
MELTDRVSDIKGVGPKKQQAFEAVGISTVGDLLQWFPRRYADKRTVTPVSSLVPGETQLVVAKLVSRRYSGYRYGKKSPLMLTANDGTGDIQIVFFNGSYLANLFNKGTTYSFYGKVTDNGGRPEMVHPEFHTAGADDDIRGLVPEYPQIPGISQPMLRKLITECVDASDDIKEWLPEYVVKEYKLAGPAFSIRNIHFPTDEKKILQARYRMIFDEMLTLETGIAYMKESGTGSRGAVIDASLADEFISSLPFEFTEGQKKVWGEISEDLGRDKPMNRLVQGDVGSGKTAVAEAACFAAVRSGWQAVMMAPTEILASQHFETFSRDFEKFGMKISLLKGGMKKSERDAVLEDLKEGRTDIIIGTHALIEPGVEFRNLGLVVTDEQHRFGVSQRKLLSEKGEAPDVLVMTATPIPRTLAVIIYGDLDISEIRTMPKGRRKIRTISGYQEDRPAIYGKVEEQLKEGRQAYVVAPLISDSDSIDARSAESLYKKLAERFSGYNVALLHGAMPQEEKDRLMTEFAAGRIDMLVSTVVIEIGINVSNATVMVVENAERFGLAQLHQLRGRVGRGSHQSYCFLIVSNETEIAKERIAIMCETSDGFRIAEEDLRLRGPGDILGTRQSGMPDVRMNDVARHPEVVKKAREAADMILARDPDLSSDEDRPLRQRVMKMFGEDMRLEI